MDCSPPSSSVPGILQARILEWVAMPPPGHLPDVGIDLHLWCLLRWQKASLPLLLVRLEVPLPQHLPLNLAASLPLFSDCFLWGCTWRSWHVSCCSPLDSVSEGCALSCWSRSPAGEDLIGHFHCSSEGQHGSDVSWEPQCLFPVLSPWVALWGATHRLLVATGDHPWAPCLPHALKCPVLPTFAHTLIFPKLFVLAAPRGMWNLGSPIGYQTHTPCSGSTDSKLLDHQGSPSECFLILCPHC